MNRLKRLVKGKGKVDEAPTQSKKQKRRELVDETSDEEMSSPSQFEEQEEEERSLKPEWKVGTSLDTLPKKWQLQLFKDKMNEAESIKKQLLGERKTILKDFEGFNLVECFDRLGWRQGLVWNNKDDPDVYQEGIIEWLGTLGRTLGSNPPETMKLTGTVNGKKVIMSFATLDKIVRFDTGPTPPRPFDYLSEDVLTGTARGDNWEDMVAELFMFRRELIDRNTKLERRYLKLFVRLLTVIVNWNIIPRTSDKAMVRYYEVVILYALCTGNLALSLRQIIMMNIWDARNKRNKMVIPHPRLITSLIRLHKAIPQGAPMVAVNQIPFSIARLGRGEWNFEETERARIIRDVKTTRYLSAPKAGFNEEDVNEDLERGGDREGHGMLEPEERRGQVGDRREQHGMRAEGDAPRGRFDRPTLYTRWSVFEQQLWDLSAGQAAAQHARHEEQRRHERAMVYAHEMEIRRRFEDKERIRHHIDYLAGSPYMEAPPHLNYQTLPPYVENTASEPNWPQSHDSEWLPRHSSAARLEGSSGISSSADPFETRSLYTGLMESIFGPPPGSQ